MYSISENNFFPLNITKWKVVSFIPKINHFVYHFNINNFPLLNVTSIKNYSFKIKYKIIDNKSYKMLSFISRNTNDFKNITCLKTLYYSLVRSYLKFGSLVWSCDFLTYNSD